MNIYQKKIDIIKSLIVVKADIEMIELYIKDLVSQAHFDGGKEMLETVMANLSKGAS